MQHYLIEHPWISQYTGRCRSKDALGFMCYGILEIKDTQCKHCLCYKEK